MIFFFFLTRAKRDIELDYQQSPLHIQKFRLLLFAIHWTAQIKANKKGEVIVKNTWLRLWPFSLSSDDAGYLWGEVNRSLWTSKVYCLNWRSEKLPGITCSCTFLLQNSLGRWQHLHVRRFLQLHYSLLLLHDPVSVTLNEGKKIILVLSRFGTFDISKPGNQSMEIHLAMTEAWTLVLPTFSPQQTS